MCSSDLTQPQPGWLASFDITGAAGTTNVVIPPEGMLAQTGVYVYMTATEVPSTTLFYG